MRRQARWPRVACLLAVVLAFGAGRPLLAQEPPAEEPTAQAVRVAEEKLWGWQTQDAREALEPVKGKAPADAAVARVLAQVLVQEKKYADAAKLLEEAAKLSPSDAAVLVSLGETYLVLNKPSQAEDAFRKAKDAAEKALAADESNAAARLQLALALKGLKQLDKAAEQLAKLVEQGQGGDAVLLYHLGVVQLLAGKADKAFETLSKALELNKGLAYAYYYRGLAADKVGKKDVLVNDMGRFLHLAPNAPEASKAKAVLAAAKR
jgi:tetratricopeptide (TPR) repeat protein